MLLHNVFCIGKGSAYSHPILNLCQLSLAEAALLGCIQVVVHKGILGSSDR